MWWSYFDTQFSTCIKFSMFFQFSLDFLFAGYFSILTCFSHLENHPNTPTSHKLSSSHQIQFSKSPAAPGRRITVWIWRYMTACYSLLMKKEKSVIGFRTSCTKLRRLLRWKIIRFSVEWVWYHTFLFLFMLQAVHARIHRQIHTVIRRPSLQPYFQLNILNSLDRFQRILVTSKCCQTEVSFPARSKSRSRSSDYICFFKKEIKEFP